MINIIGGGISGLSTALALQRNKLDYKLFEKDDEITYANVGLGISHNIRPILNEWNILEQTKELGAEITHFHFGDCKLRYLKSFRLKQPALCVNRKKFHQLLYQQLDHNKVALSSVKSAKDFNPDEMVICAEGIQSEFRQELYPQLQLRKANQVLWRGISEIRLENKFRNAYHDFIGSNIRFAIIHTGGNFYSWYIIRPLMPDMEISVGKSTLKSFFEGDHPVIRSVIEHTESIYTSELMDINPKRRKSLSWFNDNALMIGDAIHPTTPNMANGACLAIEDAYTIVNMIIGNQQPLKDIFELFQQRRKSKVDSVVTQSWWLGQLFHQHSSLMNSIVKMGIVSMPHFMFDSIYSNVLKDMTYKRIA